MKPLLLLFYFSFSLSETCHLLVEFLIQDVRCKYLGYQDKSLSLEVGYELKVNQTILWENYSKHSPTFSETIDVPYTKVVQVGTFDSCVITLDLMTQNQDQVLNSQSIDISSMYEGDVDLDIPDQFVIEGLQCNSMRYIKHKSFLINADKGKMTVQFIDSNTIDMKPFVLQKK